MREIVGALSIRDRDFRTIWAEHEARPLSGGVAPNHVDGFGWIELPWQVLDVPTGHFMNVSLAPPGTLAGAAIRHLGRLLHSVGRARGDTRASALDEKISP